MKTIKMKVTLSGLNGAYSAGVVYDLDDDIADDIVRVGFAELVEEKKKPAPKKRVKKNVETSK